MKDLHANDLYENAIREMLSRVTKPGRYIGGEMNSAPTGPSAYNLRAAFCFPDLYEIGMSYTGLQIIYGLLNSLDGVSCERAFAPAADMEALMRESRTPLFTIESHSPVREMDLLGFTLQYELSYTGVLNMLDLAGVPIRSRERSDGDPIVCAGGSCACNPEPLAEVFDFFLIGDSEEVFPIIFCKFEQWRKEGADRDELLRRLARVGGIYVPDFHEPVYAGGKYLRHEKKYAWLPDRVEKQFVADLDTAYYPEKPVVPIVEAVHERAVCEISRGCGRACRFCQAGYIYRPVRRRSPEKIRELIFAQLANTGYDEVSLLSLSASDHPDIEPLVRGLMDELREMDVSLSLPSLRLDSISEETLARIAEYKKSSLTFAPEAGTQRLRDVIRKNITEEDIFSGVEKAIAIGWNKVKLYFMIGLPTETKEDIDGIAALAEKILRRARELQEKGRRNFNLTVSVSNFVPKPHTPFQWAAGDSEESLCEKMYYLKDRLKKVNGANFKFHDTRASAVEMRLSKGDRRTFETIMRAWELGCRFDSWREHFDYEKWQRAFAETGQGAADDKYTDTSAALPWDIIDEGTDRKLLLKEYEQAISDRDTEGGAA